MGRDQEAGLGQSQWRTKEGPSFSSGLGKARSLTSQPFYRAGLVPVFWVEASRKLGYRALGSIGWPDLQGLVTVSWCLLSDIVPCALHA